MSKTKKENTKACATSCHKTHINRGLILAALLIALIVNVLATLSLKSELTQMTDNLATTQQDLAAATTQLEAAHVALEKELGTKVAEQAELVGEHDRLITALERMVNGGLDN